MKNGFYVTLAIAFSGAALNGHAAPIPPAPDNPRQAQTFLGVSIKSRCPDLRAADEGVKAVVVFWLPKRGSQSQISIKTSSGSDELDAAAISCVTKLSFAPATTIGDGEPVDSWQQIALRWAEKGNPVPARATSTAAPSPAGVQAAPLAASQPPANARPGESGGQGKSVTVHVCVDAMGKLQQEPTVVQSSGVASLDQAAVKIAASGSAYYRPQLAGGTAASGCAQLAIRFDTK